MANRSSAYSSVATALWLTAALFLVLAAARLLDLPSRYTLFLMVSIVGGLLLFRINRTVLHGQKLPPLLPAATPARPVEDTPTTDILSTMPGEGKLSAAEAREWLDTFLVRQQKKQ